MLLYIPMVCIIRKEESDMARNKYPEQTVQKILEVSCKLFREKGYEHTTIQNIVEDLGMSKGAVYHHFKSKEEILVQLNKLFYDEIGWFEGIRQDSSLNGLEKLKEIIYYSLSNERKKELDKVIPYSNKDNPRLCQLILDATLNCTSPIFAELIEEGVKDGSIHTDWPEELAQIVALLSNVWLGMFTSSKDEFIKKVNFFQEFCEKMGLPLIDERLKSSSIVYYDEVMHLRQ